ncbi:hypothetical protein QUC26_09380 [Pseudomonas asiatica]|uniref:hypothetical protein n=1 Tax=Pseudomonas asiatica TaxID=2219225 RepID=UPI0025A13F60|nr:hypothetical protein [Pseudomonas asiatica]WJM55339.1 hypothetical protein QUC26_09380 [Pseudomonas asiatica]
MKDIFKKAALALTLASALVLTGCDEAPTSTQATPTGTPATVVTQPVVPAVSIRDIPVRKEVGSKYIRDMMAAGFSHPNDPKDTRMVVVRCIKGTDDCQREAKSPLAAQGCAELSAVYLAMYKENDPWYVEQNARCEAM